MPERNNVYLGNTAKSEFGPKILVCQIQAKNYAQTIVLHHVTDCSLCALHHAGADQFCHSSRKWRKNRLLRYHYDLSQLLSDHNDRHAARKVRHATHPRNILHYYDGRDRCRTDGHHFCVKGVPFRKRTTCMFQGPMQSAQTQAKERDWMCRQIEIEEIPVKRKCRGKRYNNHGR